MILFNTWSFKTQFIPTTHWFE